MLKSFVDKLFNSYNQKQISQLEKTVKIINQHYQTFSQLEKTALQKKFSDWKKQLSDQPEQLEVLLPEVFAGIKRAAELLVGHEYEIRGKTEAWNMVHYDVQLIGGAVLHQGKIAEMKTGEGKTLVCTLPVILNALTGKGVHVVTVNDYLAARDAEWMKPLYEFCGLSVAIIVNETEKTERKAAYAADITYGTNNEFGFDYLRDNMAQEADNLVQRAPFFAIVDEVDSILIDEARTPLIISAPGDESTDKYGLYAQMIPQLQVGEDYEIDLKQKSVHLTEAGVGKLESLLGVDNFYHQGGFSEVHQIENALKANVAMVKDQDYVIRDGKVVIIDEFTGRMMAGRRFSDGLHQALEAKEGVEIQRESKTLATITFQNYFRLYEKLAGMTGTAETEAEEFAKIYRLDTIVIPTNCSIARQDLPDKIFKNQAGKLQNLLKHVQELNQTGQPVLIGTVNIDQSEFLSQALSKADIAHEVLNAKQHEREAEIVANAGQKDAVTIATNMAGRGTDIKLGEGVKELGGLAILGTERHESRRIDNQLRGRAGRQGDPGFTQFYVAMTDQLMRRFGGEKLEAIMERMGLPENEAIENSMISRAVENAQKKIEGFHFDARKHIVQYDDVMNIHRSKMYARRHQMLGSESILDEIEQLIRDLTEQLVDQHAPTPEADRIWDMEALLKVITSIHQSQREPLSLEELEQFTHKNELQESLENYLLQAWDHKQGEFPEGLVDTFAKQIVLHSIDELWLSHIDEMTHLRDRVALSGYAQKDPVMEYKSQAFQLFAELLQNIRTQSVSNLFHARIEPNPNWQPTVDESQMKTNADQIVGDLENTAEFGVGESANSGLSRQQRRALERKKK